MQKHKQQLLICKPQQLRMVHAMPEVWFKRTCNNKIESGHKSRVIKICFVFLSGGMSTIVCQRGIKAPQLVVAESGWEISQSKCVAVQLLPPYTSKHSIPLHYIVLFGTRHGTMK